MGLFDRISLVVRSNLNDLVSKAEDPEKVLEQAVIDMSEDLGKLRVAVAQSIAEQKRTEQKCKIDVSEASKWEQRAKLALTKGDESLAREALTRKKNFTETSTILKQQLEQQTAQVDALRRNLIALESKISEAKTKKNMLQARAKAAQANEQLQKTLGGIDSSRSMGAFERMEEKVLEQEARSQAVGELAGYGIENQFAALESGGDVDDELAMLKAEIAGSAAPKGILPGTPTSTSRASTPRDSVVDAELEDLKKQLDQL